MLLILASITVKTPNDTSQKLPHAVQCVLEVGSAVQFGNPVQYGVIKIIEKDPHSNIELAEIETVSINFIYVAPVACYNYVM